MLHQQQTPSNSMKDIFSLMPNLMCQCVGENHGNQNEDCESPKNLTVVSGNEDSSSKDDGIEENEKISGHDCSYKTSLMGEMDLSMKSGKKCDKIAKMGE